MAGMPKKTVNRAPIAGGGGGGGSTQFAQQLETTVTAPPLVGCVVWSPGMFVCSSFLISVCMFIVSKALLISSATVIVCAGGC